MPVSKTIFPDNIFLRVNNSDGEWKRIYINKNSKIFTEKHADTIQSSCLYVSTVRFPTYSFL